MVRRFVLLGTLLTAMMTVSGCLSLTDWDENVRQINHYGDTASEWRDMTNKYFFDYDKHNPFDG